MRRTGNEKWDDSWKRMRWIHESRKVVEWGMVAFSLLISWKSTRVARFCACFAIASKGKDTIKLHCKMQKWWCNAVTTSILRLVSAKSGTAITNFLLHSRCAQNQDSRPRRVQSRLRFDSLSYASFATKTRDLKSITSIETNKPNEIPQKSASSRGHRSTKISQP